MTRSKIILLDEPSMGLASLIVEEVFRIIRKVSKEGMTILLVEQNAFMALSIAHRTYVMETGSIVASGTGQEVLEMDAVQKAYLGV